MAWSKRTFAGVVGLTALISIGATAAGVIAATQGSTGSEAEQVACPSVGPSGQTGEMTCYETHPSPFSGGDVAFGPYRLLPPGTQFIERDYGPPPATTDFRDETNAEVVRAWWNYTPPPEGVREVSLTGRTFKEEPFQIYATWEVAGSPIHVVVTDYPDSMFPLDVYLHPEGSRISVLPEKLAGQFSIVQEPAEGPAPNVGYVAIWLDEFELALRSPDVGHDVLRAVAESVASAR